MPDDLNQLLKKARSAYKSGDRGKGAYYVDRILKQDYLHRGTWKLLYRQYGRGLTFDEFRYEFTEQYYPDQIEYLRSGKPGPVQSHPASTIPGGEARTSEETSSNPPEDTPAEPKGAQAVKPVIAVQSAQAIPTPPPASIEKPTQPAPYVAAEALAVQKKKNSKKTEPDFASPLPPPTKPLKKGGKTPSASSSATGVVDKSPKIRVLVADDTAQTREIIIRSLGFEREVEVVATAENGIQAVEMARQTKPDVVLMDVNMPDMDGITATAEILERVPYAQIVILTVQNDPDYMRRAMMAGARDFLTKPPALDDLLNTVLQAGKIAHQEVRKVAQSAKGGLGSIPALSAQGKLITVYSPKGGTGCSTIVTNLGIALHNEESTVLLVDGNLQYGDIAELFNMRASQTILNLATHAYDLDIDLAEEAVISHESGLKLLTHPSLEQADSVRGDQLIEVLKYLREIYPYVLVNTSSQLSDATIAALEMSDLILLSVTQEISSITKVRRFLDTLNLLKIDKNRVLLILNQYDKQQDVLPEMISKSLKHEIAMMIPRDERVVTPAINRGVPFMLKVELKNRQISRSILDLAELVRRKLLELSKVSETPEAKVAQVR